MLDGEKAVAVVALSTGVMAMAIPGTVVKWWPSRKDMCVRLMQGWGIATIGLGLCLADIKPRHAATWVCAISVPWDLDYGGRIGAFAACLNLTCVLLLHQR